MSERLTAQDWIDFAIGAFAREGADVLKADVLARRLGVSRGSFYWHFADLNAFHAAVVEKWKSIATEAIIADVDRYASSEARLDALLRRAFGEGSDIEIRMRFWGGGNAEAARALAEVDARRQDYIRQLLEDAGLAPASAALHARLLYWAYLGAALDGARLRGQELERAVAVLKDMALSPPG